MLLTPALADLIVAEHRAALAAVLLAPVAISGLLFAAAFLAQRGHRPAAAWLGSLRARAPLARLLALLLALDVALHAGLAAGHAGEDPAVAALFAADALALLAIAIWMTLAEGWEPVALVFLVANLVAYAWFLDSGRESADALGLACKLLELIAVALTIAQTIRWSGARDVAPA